MTLAPASSRGQRAPNWCVLDLVIPAALTSGTPNHVYVAADVSVNAQSGADFSIAGDAPGGKVAVHSAVGGAFQASAYMESPQDATLDAGSSALRWLGFGFVVGSNVAAANPFSSAGLSQHVPVVSGAGGGGAIFTNAASTIGYTPAGGIALWNMALVAGGLQAGDSIPLDFSGPYQILLWQVG